MDPSFSPGPRSPSAVLMPSQQQTAGGRSMSQAPHQSPSRASLQPPGGPWHCPGNVSTDHAAQLAHRLLSPNRALQVRTRPSQEHRRRAPLSQGAGPLNSSGPLDADGARHLRIIPETQSMDESPLCAGVLEALPTQTSGVGAARGAQQSSVIPRLRQEDPGPTEAAARRHRRRSQSAGMSHSTSSKVVRRSGSVAMSPQGERAHGTCEAVHQPHLSSPGDPPAVGAVGMLCAPTIAEVSDGESLRALAMAGGRNSDAVGRGNRKRRSRSAAMSGTEAGAQPLDSRSGGCPSAGHSTFRPPVCSQTPQPICAHKVGKRRRITPTQISTGGAPWPPSVQAVLRQHRPVGGNPDARSAGAAAATNLYGRLC